MQLLLVFGSEEYGQPSLLPVVLERCDNTPQFFLVRSATGQVYRAHVSKLKLRWQRPAPGAEEGGA